MATYKLIQDIEAEDHILGPLTLRQFIFALIAAFMFYMSFFMVTKHVAFMLVIFLPPGLFFGFFAIPFGRDQPTEVWFLAKLRFWFKPRKRIWDQSGVKELVTITVPKKIEPVLTNGLSQYEVKSRLTALANTLDSRGWVVKNANTPSATAAFMFGNQEPASDRLLAVQNDMATDDSTGGPDILDSNYSPIAQQFDHMINESSEAHRQQLIQQMNAPVDPPHAVSTTQIPQSNGQWFMPHVDDTPQPIHAPSVAAQDATADEAALAAKLRAQHYNQQVYSSNLRTLQPLGVTRGDGGMKSNSAGKPVNDHLSTSSPLPLPQVPDNTGPVQTQTTSTSSSLTSQPDPAILSLANNNDFTVETLAREAKRAKNEELGQDEVVISLH